MAHIPPFTPIEVDREGLTIMGVPFPDAETLDNCASGIGSNMYEGFRPTPRDVEVIRDFAMGKITAKQVAEITKEEFRGRQKQI